MDLLYNRPRHRSANQIDIFAIFFFLSYVRRDRWQGNHLASGIECKYLRPHFLPNEFERFSNAGILILIHQKRCARRECGHNVG